MGYKIFRCTDANAPVLSGTKGSLVNVIRKCLIDGYGTKTPAPGGWLMPFISADLQIAVFRNNPSVSGGAFLLVDESTPAANSFNADAYEMMTGVSTGSGRFWTTTPNYTTTKSNALNATGRWWTLIANEKTFHMLFFDNISYPGSLPTITLSSVHRILSFGDYVDVYATEPCGCFLSVTAQVGTTITGMFCGNQSFNTANTSRNYLQAADTPVQLKSLAQGPLTAGTRFSGPAYNGKLLLSKVMLHDNLNQFIGFRGIVDGCYHVCHDVMNFTFGQEIVDGLKKYVVFPMSFYANSANNSIVYAFEYESE